MLFLDNQVQRYCCSHQPKEWNSDWIFYQPRIERNLQQLGTSWTVFGEKYSWDVWNIWIRLDIDWLRLHGKSLHALASPWWYSHFHQNRQWRKVDFKKEKWKDGCLGVKPSQWREWSCQRRLFWFSDDGRWAKPWDRDHTGEQTINCSWRGGANVRTYKEEAKVGWVIMEDIDVVEQNHTVTSALLGSS